MKKYLRTHDDIVKKIPKVYIDFVKLNIELVKEIDRLFIKQLSKKGGVYQGEVKDFLRQNPGYQTNAYSVMMVKAGRVKEIPYHDYYKFDLKKIVILINDIKNEVNNIKESFNAQRWLRFYSSLEKAFLTDEWEKADKEFLRFDESAFFLMSVGPIERYHDKILGTKRFYTAVFLYKNLQYQFYNKIWNSLSEVTRNNLSFLPISDENKAVHLFIGDVVSEGGEVAKLDTEGWSRPENVNLAKKYGTIKMIMVNNLKSKVAKLVPFVKKARPRFELDKKLKTNIENNVEKLYLLSLILHEYGHTYLKPNNASFNLGKYYTLIEEGRAEINSLYLSYLLEQNSMLDKGATRDLLVLDWLLFEYKYQRYKNMGLREEYLYSTSLWLLKAQQYEILEIKNGKFYIDLNKMDENLDNFLIDIFTFLNTVAFFGSKDNEHLRKYRERISIYTEKYMENFG